MKHKYNLGVSSMEQYFDKNNNEIKEGMTREPLPPNLRFGRSF
jgi:hypothetical protein